MEVVVKAFLQDTDANVEVRRIPVSTTGQDNNKGIFKETFAKVGNAFPGLVEKNFSLKWKDSDGDLVMMTTDEEMLEAIAHSPNAPLKVFISVEGVKEAGFEILDDLPADASQEPNVGGDKASDNQKQDAFHTSAEFDFGDPMSFFGMSGMRKRGHRDGHNPRGSFGNLNPRGGHLGPLGGHMGPSGGHLGFQSSHLRPHGGPFNPRGGHINPRGGHFDPRGGHINPRGGHLSPRSGHPDPCGGHLGSCGGNLGSRGNHFANMGPRGHHFDSMGARGHHFNNLGPRGHHFDNMGPRGHPFGHIGHHGGHQFGNFMGMNCQFEGQDFGEEQNSCQEDADKFFGHHFGHHFSPRGGHPDPCGGHLGSCGGNLGSRGHHFANMGPRGHHFDSMGARGHHFNNMGPRGHHFDNMGPRGHPFGHIGHHGGHQFRNFMGMNCQFEGQDFGEEQNSCQEDADKFFGHHFGHHFSPRGGHPDPCGGHLGSCGGNLGSRGHHFANMGPRGHHFDSMGARGHHFNNMGPRGHHFDNMGPRGHPFGHIGHHGGHQFRNFMGMNCQFEGQDFGEEQNSCQEDADMFFGHHFGHHHGDHHHHHGENGWKAKLRDAVPVAHRRWATSYIRSWRVQNLKNATSTSSDTDQEILTMEAASVPEAYAAWLDIILIKWHKHLSQETSANDETEKNSEEKQKLKVSVPKEFRKWTKWYLAKHFGKKDAPKFRKGGHSEGKMDKLRKKDWKKAFKMETLAVNPDFSHWFKHALWQWDGRTAPEVAQEEAVDIQQIPPYLYNWMHKKMMKIQRKRMQHQFKQAKHSMNGHRHGYY